MRASITIKDDFSPDVVAVRDSALQSGFGTWRPNKGEIGTSVYEGMNFWGRHSLMLRALSAAVGGRPVFPNNMFFRATKPGMEAAYVHSDRAWGTWTCIVYLSEHTEVSGTGFYRHRASGLLEMPTLEEMHDKPEFNTLKADMVNPTEQAWEQTDFVRGVFNRALVFYAPLFHSRLPREGIGTEDQNARMVWVCHFEL